MKIILFVKWIIWVIVRFSKVTTNSHVFFATLKLNQTHFALAGPESGRTGGQIEAVFQKGLGARGKNGVHHKNLVTWENQA